MNDDPKSDATWFTPPDRGSAASNWPAAPAAPSVAEPPLAVDFLELVPLERPEPPVQHEPLEPSEPARPSAMAQMFALAPPTPIIRPLPPSRPAAEPAEQSQPEPEPVEAPADDGGPGWRIRQTCADAPPAGVVDAPSRRISLELDPEPPPVLPVMGWEQPPRVARPMRRYLLFGAGLFALFGLTALVFGGVGRSGPSIQQPSTVGALSQVESPEISAMLQTIQRYEQSIGASSVVTGAYGSGSQPQLLLVVVEGGIVGNGGTRQAVDAFMHGLTAGAGGAGWTLDPSKLTVTPADGTTFECDNGPSAQLNGDVLGVCAWTDPQVAGAVVDLTGQALTDTLNEAVQARASSVR